MEKFFQAIASPKYYRILIGLFIVLSAILSIAKTSKMGKEFDFYTFYASGQDFQKGAPLYEEKPGVATYIYPPFAAMLFQVFSVFPLRVASIIFYFINFLLIPGCILLIIEILKELGHDTKKLKVPLLLAFAFGIKYFWDNIIYSQMNEILFFLTLWGIYFIAKKNYSFAVSFLVVAANIKVIPIVFIGWLVYRKFKKQVILPLILSSVICLAAPFMFRGLDQGTQDYKDFYNKFLKSFQNGQVIQDKANQNLAGAIYRYTVFYDYELSLDYRIFPTTEEVAKKIYIYSVGTILLSIFLYLTFMVLKKRPIDIHEISILFLFCHLVSGITWKAHLVTFVFTLLPLFIYLKKPLNVFQVIILLLVVVTGVAGKDVVGSTIHYYMSGFSIYVWLMLLLFYYYLWESLTIKEPSLQTSDSQA